MATIKSIDAYEVLDSRGTPTVKAVVELSDGTVASSQAPTGGIQEQFEAQVLYDSDLRRYGGKGVLGAIDNIKKVISPKLLNIEAGEQQKIDKILIDLDGTPNKSTLGGNATLSISQAVLKAAAKSAKLPLFAYIRQVFADASANHPKIPIPIFNLIEGGKHAPGGIDFQEILVIPASSKTYSESLQIGYAVLSSLRNILREKGLSSSNAPEGGFAPSIATNREAVALLKRAIDESGFTFSLDAFMGIDANAQSFIDGKSYKIKDKSVPYSVDELVEYYNSLFSEFALLYVEDGFGHEDVQGWKKMFAALAQKTLIVGDDIVATNPFRLQTALENNVLNGIVVKPSQAGTITEAVAIIEIARYKKLKIIVSQRSNETMDSFIADFAVGVDSDFVKFGAPIRERVIKYNRLLEIERELSS